MSYFISIYIKFFFIMTPFFVVSMFLSMTQELEENLRKKIAIKVTTAVIATSIILLFFGQYIFDLFGITLNAFKIGAGALLFLTAVELMKTDVHDKPECSTDIEKHTIVPLAIPITVGPGTIGALLVMGGEMTTVSSMMIGSLALICSIVSIGAMLYLSSSIQKVVGVTGLIVLSKITALILSALSAQLIFTGIKDFLSL